MFGSIKSDTTVNLSRYLLTLSIIFLISTNAFSQKPKRNGDIPTVSYCDLVSKPADFDRKIVRVKAKYTASFEGSIMEDSQCNSKYTWVRFELAYEASTNREVLNEFQRLTDTSPETTREGGVLYPSRQVQVTWIGRFDGVKRRFKNAPKEDPGVGYGHMGGYDFQFNVLKVESVSSSR
jgi:hypothetical protein